MDFNDAKAILKSADLTSKSAEDVQLKIQSCACVVNHLFCEMARNNKGPEFTSMLCLVMKLLLRTSR